MMDALLIGTAAFTNDIMIASETQDELFNCLFSLFERIHQYGFHVQA